MTILTDLTELTAPARGDLLYMVNAPGSTPVDRKVTVQSLLGGTFLVAASNAPDAIKRRADWVCDGVNDEVEIQSAIDALPAIGGKIEFSAGTFTLDSVNELDHPGASFLEYAAVVISESHGPVDLAGGVGTTFKWAAGQPKWSTMFLVRSIVAPRVASTVIRGIEFDGNSGNQDQIWEAFGLITISNLSEIVGNESVMIQDCFFHDWARAGGAIYVGAYCEKIHILDNKFHYESAMCIRTHAPLFDIRGNLFLGVYDDSLSCAVSCYTADLNQTRTEQSIISGNRFRNGTVGVRIEGGQDIIIANNTFRDLSNGGYAVDIRGYIDAAWQSEADRNIIHDNVVYNCSRGIRVQAASTAGCRLNHIHDNTIIEGATRDLVTGIYEAGASNLNNTIESNTIVGATTPIDASGPGVVVRGNHGHVTESHGAAAAVADGGTIAHGCAATPASVQVSGSVAGEIVTVTSVDATNITVAVKTAAGEAGTAQTVYWRAWV
jgi:hypothetical protein